MRKVVFFACLLVLWSFPVVAQTGGKGVYNFLNGSFSSRNTALGNNLISVYDNDPTLIILNPSYIGQRHHNILSLDFTNAFGRTSCASAAYSYTFSKAGSFAAELRYVGYGSFEGMDECGLSTGTFSANDLALTIGWGRELSTHFSIGANLKFVYCGYEMYHSFGIAADVAGSYFNHEKNLSMTLLAKNLGAEIKPFTPENHEWSAFDLQWALSQRLQHVPFRYHLSLHHLYRWNMNYYGKDNPFLPTDAMTNTVIYPSKASQFFDNFFRHIVFGLEIEPVKYFSLHAAYNHNVHQEMKVVARSSLAGFSYGFMLNIKGVQVGFARQHYAIGATPNCFNFALHFDELSKLHQEKKTKKLERVDSR